MNRTFTLLALLAGCTDAPNESFGVAAIKDPIEIDEDCPITGCGVNAGFVKGVYFADLNFDGVTPNDQGVVQDGFPWLPGGAVTLDVWKNRFVGLGPNPPVLGTALTDSRLSVKINGVSWPVHVAEVHVEGSYWARKEGAPPDRTVESYRFVYYPDPVNPSTPQDVCVAEPTLGGQLQFDGVVFEGERYDAERKTVEWSGNAGWFNIACFSGAAAKTHMMRRTWASSNGDYTSSPAERQAMIRAWTADYCGGGKAFTTTGTRLLMRDSKKWIPLDSKWSWSKDLGVKGTELKSYEAIWNEFGAVCLNKPRKFGTDQEVNDEFRERIKQECIARRGKDLEPCSSGNLPVGWETRGFFLTANPWN